MAADPTEQFEEWFYAVTLFLPPGTLAASWYWLDFAQPLRPQLTPTLLIFWAASVLCLIALGLKVRHENRPPKPMHVIPSGRAADARRMTSADRRPGVVDEY